MDKASASGAGDSRFESWAGHIAQAMALVWQPCSLNQVSSKGLHKARPTCSRLGHSIHNVPGADMNMVPRGLEPRTLRLLAVRSDQLSYETN